MEFIETKVQGVVILEPKVFGDERGFFMETFRANEFAARTGARPFVQDNHSKSAQGILRGLHYQIENPQGKLVRVVQGAVYDVAVDLREDSPSFGQWVGVELSAENKRQLWVPEGCAHGFYVITPSAEFIYKCTDYYNPAAEVSLRWDDPALNIDWPLVNGEAPRLSAKDADGKVFAEVPKFTGLLS